MWWSLHLVLREGQPLNRLEQLDSAFFTCHKQPSNLFLRQHKRTRPWKKDAHPPKKKKRKGIYSVSVLYEKRLTKVRYIVRHKTTPNKTERKKRPRVRRDREVKCGIKNGPP